jgi:hypothetical protein
MRYRMFGPGPVGFNSMFKRTSSRPILHYVFTGLRGRQVCGFGFSRLLTSQMTIRDTLTLCRWDGVAFRYDNTRVQTRQLFHAIAPVNKGVGRPNSPLLAMCCCPTPRSNPCNQLDDGLSASLHSSACFHCR